MGKTLEAYTGKEGTSVRSPIWNFPVRYRTTDLVTELKELREQLRQEERAAEQQGEVCQAETSTPSEAAAPVEAITLDPQCREKRAAEATQEPLTAEKRL